MNDQKQIKIPVWNTETDEIEEIFMDEDVYKAWLEAEQQYEYEQYQKRRTAAEHEARERQFHRD